MRLNPPYRRAVLAGVSAAVFIGAPSVQAQHRFGGGNVILGQSAITQSGLPGGIGGSFPTTFGTGLSSCFTPCVGLGTGCYRPITRGPLFPSYGYCGGPFWGGYPLVFGGGYVGLPWSYSSFYSSTAYLAGGGYGTAIDEENSLLRRRVDALEEQNQRLRNAGDPANAAAAKAANDKDRVAAAEKARQTIVTGAKLFESGQYRRAADSFRSVARMAKDDPAPQFLLAQALIANRQYAAAADAVREGLRLSPDWPELGFDVRGLYGDPADFSRQLSDLARQLRQNPFDKDGMFLLGYQLFSSGEQGKARTILAQAARLDADDRRLQPFFDYFAKNNAPATTKPPGP